MRKTNERAFAAGKKHTLQNQRELQGIYLMGQKVLGGVLSGSGTNFQIETSGLTNGIYILEVNSNESTGIIQFIHQ